MSIILSAIIALGDLATLAGLFMTIVTIVGLGLGAGRYLRGQSVKSLVDQKNGIIDTLNQTVEALEKRLEVLEHAVAEEQKRSNVQQEKITELEHKLQAEQDLRRELERYTAPVLAPQVLDSLARIEDHLGLK